LLIAAIVWLILRRTGNLAATPRVLVLGCLKAVLVSVNWCVHDLVVRHQSGHREAGPGYDINLLVSIALDGLVPGEPFTGACNL